MKTTAIIQARMCATRLPGKVLKQISGKTVLEHVIERVGRAQSIDEVIVSTSVDRSNLPVVHLVSGLDISIYCGSENDVLERYYESARLFSAESIVRITADCPLIDPEIIDMVVEKYYSSGADYCSNVLKETFPDGLDVEVFSFKALEKAYENAALKSEREHVTPYIRNNADIFQISSHEYHEDLSHHRWTLDTPEDLDFIRSIYDRLYPDCPDFGYKNILAVLEREPELLSINNFHKRNLGYLKSLAEDS